MIFRIFPCKDTFITNLVAPFVNLPVTGSNFGASEILELFKKGPNSSGSAGWPGSSSLGRVLMQFDFSQWNELTGTTQAPLSPAWRLVMRNARHAETLPSSFDVEFLPLSRSWDEGGGLDEDTFVDRGQANWVQAKSTSFWSTPGGDFLMSPSSVQHFDVGYEDVDVNIGPVVSLWLSGTVPNNGLLARMSSTLETNGTEYYVKKFHSRQTNFLDRRPYIEARWDDSLRDDRSNFLFDYSGTLYLYNSVRGQMTNIPGVLLGQNCMTVRITDLSGTLMVTSASWTGQTGIYSCSFALPTASYSGSTMSDIWSMGVRTYLTGNFTPGDSVSAPKEPTVRMFLTLPNLRSEYTVDELAQIRVFMRPFDYNPPYVLTGSAPTPVGTIINRGYYRIDNDRTKEQVVPFGTGSYAGGSDWTRLSYDADGNYFNFHMGNLAPGNVYRIVFLVDENGKKQLLDDGFKFKVV